MTRSLVALWTTLAVAIIALIVLAQFWVTQRATSAQQRVAEILQSQLEPHSNSIVQVLEDYSIALQSELEHVELSEPAQCVQLKKFYLCDALIVVDSESYLVFPSELSRETQEKQSLVDEALQLLREQISVRTKGQQLQQVAVQSSLALPRSLNNANPAPTNRGAESPQPAEQRNALPQSDTLSQQAAGIGDYLELESVSESQAPVPPRSRIYYGRDGNRGSTSQESAGLDTAVLESQQAMNQVPPALEERLATEQFSSPLPSSLLDAERREANQSVELQRGADFGWVTWYHRRGMVLGFWWRLADGTRAIVALPRARWMADIVATLPDSESLGTLAPAARDAGTVQQLVDVEGQVIYQWGNVATEFWEEVHDRKPTAEIPVAAPLEGWRLRSMASDGQFRRLAGDSMVVPIWFGVASVSFALAICGLFVTLTLNRQMRLARSRVSFVNQVSHELRTPLTNIRMYAELLAADLEDNEAGETNARAADRIGVIQGESQRLSRLINNVLEFARSDQKDKPLRRSPRCLDELVEEVVETFRPRLEELGFEIHLDLQTGPRRQLDSDAIEQILVNLISNAEKYAVAGKWLAVLTREQGDRVSLLVQDRGPGVPARLSQRVFEPFERLSDRIEDPAGTGIGLTIVRELARKHGGDCEILPSDQGALFRCEVVAPVWDEDKTRCK